MVKGITAFTAGLHARSPGQLVLRNTEVPKRLQQSIYLLITFIFGCAGSMLLHVGSLVVVSGATHCSGFSLRSIGSGARGL